MSRAVAPITRKAFLQVMGSMAALGCGLASAVSAAPVLAAAGLGRRPAGCDAAMFAAHLHTRFRVSDDSGHRADLELTHVHEFACDPALEQFSLVFEGAGGQSSLAGTCRFDHPALGPLTLFITPAALPDPQRSIYQAAFNRRRGTRHEA